MEISYISEGGFGVQAHYDVTMSDAKTLRRRLRAKRAKL